MFFITHRSPLLSFWQQEMNMPYSYPGIRLAMLIIHCDKLRKLRM
jgi:hypothetical protein